MSENPLESPTTGAIRMRGLGICFGAGKNAVDAVRGIDADIAPGAFVSVLGPSGCGKSTIIGAIAGFTKLTAGELLVDGAPIRKPGADRGVVFQQHTLFPWKTALGNVEFGLKMRGVGKTERRERAREILSHVGLGDFLRHYPSQLSGGMQQRVSLARVLVNRPRVLLMDEPFSALDAQTRLQMQEMLLDLWQEFRMTVVFVTHDIDESIFLSDRIFVISQRPGRVKAEITVNLSRPRTPELLTSPEFMHLKQSCMNLLRTERIQAAAKATTPLPEPARKLALALDT
ncbi:MAG: ABC transporter ATP-binding protein [Chthoniobacteraceae bacterium]